MVIHILYVLHMHCRFSVMLELHKVFRIALLVCAPVADDVRMPRAAVRLLLALMHRVHGGDRIVLQAHRENVRPFERLLLFLMYCTSISAGS